MTRLISSFIVINLRNQCMGIPATILLLILVHCLLLLLASEWRTTIHFVHCRSRDYSVILLCVQFLKEEVILAVLPGNIKSWTTHKQSIFLITFRATSNTAMVAIVPAADQSIKEWTCYTFL